MVRYTVETHEIRLGTYFSTRKIVRLVLIVRYETRVLRIILFLTLFSSIRKDVEFLSLIIFFFFFFVISVTASSPVFDIWNGENN